MLLAVKQYQARSLQVSGNCKRRLCIYILNLKPTLSTFADEVNDGWLQLFQGCVSVCVCSFSKLTFQGLCRWTHSSRGNSQGLKAGIQSFNLSRFLNTVYRIQHFT